MPGLRRTIVEPREWRALRYEAAQAAGLTLEQIAKQEGISRERVRQIVGGSKREHYQKQMVVRCRRNHPEWTTAVIAEIVGRKEWFVRQALKDAGLRTRAHKPKQTRAERARKRREWMAQRDRTHVPHGTADGYRNWACRCEDCRVANRESQKTAKHKAATKACGVKAKARGCPLNRHGTTGGYMYYGCRCDLCRTAMRSRWRETDSRRRGVPREAPE